MPAPDPADPPPSEATPAGESMVGPRAPSDVPSPSAAGEWAAAAASFEWEASAFGDAPAAAPLLYEAGHICEERLGDPAAALSFHRRAFELDPGFVPNLRACRRIAMDRGDDSLAAEVLAAEAAAAPADAARSGLLLDEERRLRLSGDLAGLARFFEERRAGSTDGVARSAWSVRAAEAWERAGEPERSLAAYQAALADAPASLPALRGAHGLLVRKGDWAAARATIQAEGAALRDLEGAAAAWIAAGDIARVKLLDPDAASADYKNALAIAPESAEALACLVRVDLALGRLPEAAAALRRLVDVPGIPKPALIDHLLDLAETDGRLGESGTALAACQRALALEPSHERALRLLVRLEGAGGDPRSRVAALERAASAACDVTLRADAHAEAARLCAGPLQGRARAIEHLRAALVLEPARDGERAALAELLADIAPLAALDEHRVLIARDPFRLASWTVLYRHFERTRAHDRAYVAATVLRWLGAPSPGPAAERLLLEGDRQALSAPPPLGADGWDLLRAPGDQGALADVVAIAGDAIAAAAGASRDALGEPLRDDHPFRRVLADLATALGAPPYQVCTGAPGRVDVEARVPSVVRVGPDLARRTTAREQRFLLGRVAARLRSRSFLAEVLPPEALAEWALAAARCALGAANDDLARGIARVLGRRARRALDPPARALVAAGQATSVEAWRSAAARTADRAGLVLCGDVPTAAEVLLRGPEGGALDRTRALAAAASRPDVCALLAFASTDAHFALRQRLRVAIA